MPFKVKCRTVEYDIVLKPAVNLLCRHLWVQNPKGEGRSVPFTATPGNMLDEFCVSLSGNIVVESPSVQGSNVSTKDYSQGLI